MHLDFSKEEIREMVEDQIKAWKAKAETERKRAHASGRE
jgi:hypothetical protein